MATNNSAPKKPWKTLITASDHGFVHDTFFGFSRGFFWPGLIFTFLGVLVITGTRPVNWDLFLAGLIILVASFVSKFISGFFKKR
ncbi:MAG: hypothetical protein ABIH00_01105 [Armatimonadota bacterium]